MMKKLEFICNYNRMNLEEKKIKKDYQEMINNYQGGDLDLSGCNIKTLELDHVDGSLNLSKATIGKLSIGWVSNTLNMTGAEIKRIEKPIDAKFVNMTNAKIGKLPEHIWTDSFTMEKSDIEKLNTDIRANVFNIKNTKITSLPKNMRVKRLIVDTKTAKNLSLMTLKQCDELVFDNVMYSEQNITMNNFDFSNVVNGSNMEMVSTF